MATTWRRDVKEEDEWIAVVQRQQKSMSVTCPRCGKHIRTVRNPIGVVGDSLFEKCLSCDYLFGYRVVAIENAFEEGGRAFRRGEGRILPENLYHLTTKEKEEWYRGWDSANVGGPVTDWQLHAEGITMEHYNLLANSFYQAGWWTEARPSKRYKDRFDLFIKRR